MRYFFNISYNGGSFNGWQKHPKAQSIQETIEIILSKIFHRPLQIVGCGRTDAKVHATQFFFHVDLPDSWDFDLLFRLNKSLPKTISVVSFHPVSEKAHARFDATQRRYNYLLHTEYNCFVSKLSTHYAINLDLKAMSMAAKMLKKHKDFRALCTGPDKYKHTICMLTETKLSVDPTGKMINFEICSNRFLTRMIRIIVGNLIQIGKGNMEVSAFEALIESREPPKKMHIAHPNGLYLSKVTYPYLDLSPQYHPFLDNISWTAVPTI